MLSFIDDVEAWFGGLAGAAVWTGAGEPLALLYCPGFITFPGVLFVRLPALEFVNTIIGESGGMTESSALGTKLWPDPS